MGKKKLMKNYGLGCATVAGVITSGSIRKGAFAGGSTS